ncbi:acyl carrier protein [Clostridium akagii]|uniref:acyl carrier protein n=1 Tax=Clostridium akagii TaxID=91623 RepID=UPI00047C3BB1|nr:phosphopantetheine-binding protein [Clostridium akagii]
MDDLIVNKVMKIMKKFSKDTEDNILINLDTDLVNELRFDSIMTIKMMIELNEEFNINLAEISDDLNFSDIKKVSDVVSLIEKCIKNE